MFSNRLKKSRLDKKLTLKALGDKIGMAESTISLYESGKREPDLETVQKISTILNVTTDYLLGRTDDPTPPGQKEKPAEEIQWGDFSYALYNESQDLSEEDRDEILDVVRLMVQKKKERQQKEKSSE